MTYPEILTSGINDGKKNRERKRDRTPPTERLVSEHVLNVTKNVNQGKENKFSIKRKKKIRNGQKNYKDGGVAYGVRMRSL